MTDKPSPEPKCAFVKHSGGACCDLPEGHMIHHSPILFGRNYHDYVPPSPEPSTPSGEPTCATCRPDDGSVSAERDCGEIHNGPCCGNDRHTSEQINEPTFLKRVLDAVAAEEQEPTRTEGMTYEQAATAARAKLPPELLAGGGYTTFQMGQVWCNGFYGAWHARDAEISAQRQENSELHALVVERDRQLSERDKQLSEAIRARDFSISNWENQSAIVESQCKQIAQYIRQLSEANARADSERNLHDTTRANFISERTQRTMLENVLSSIHGEGLLSFPDAKRIHELLSITDCECDQ